MPRPFGATILCAESGHTSLIRPLMIVTLKAPFRFEVALKKFPSHDARKMSLYFPQEMADHVAEQAQRLDRSKSWVVQECVRLSHSLVKQMEGPPDIDEAWLAERQAKAAAEASA